MNAASRGTVASGGAADTEFILTPTGNFAATSWGVIFFGYFTGGADRFVSVTDTHGNTWTPFADVQLGGGTEYFRILMSDLAAGALTTSDALTFLFSSSVRMVGTLTEVQLDPLDEPLFVAAEAANSTLPTPSIEILDQTLDHLLIAGVFKHWNSIAEPSASIGPDTDTLNGTWQTGQAVQAVGTLGSTFDLISQPKVLTASGDQLYDPPNTGSLGNVALAWIEIGLPPVEPVEPEEPVRQRWYRFYGNRFPADGIQGDVERQRRERREDQ